MIHLHTTGTKSQELPQDNHLLLVAMAPVGTRATVIDLKGIVIALPLTVTAVLLSVVVDLFPKALALLPMAADPPTVVTEALSLL